MFVMMVGYSVRKKEENVLKGIRLLNRFPKKNLETSVRSEVLRQYREWYTVMISMVLTRMVAAFGAEAIATQRVGGQIESVSWNTADGFAATLNAFVGQNYGAKKWTVCRKAIGYPFGR